MFSSILQLNLSHNQFSFFTKKSFPSHVYTPSYLESIDMSFNEIPIVTLEITIGTSKVKHLNLSHNSIDEIRPGIRHFINILDVNYVIRIFFRCTRKLNIVKGIRFIIQQSGIDEQSGKFT